MSELKPKLDKNFQFQDHITKLNEDTFNPIVNSLVDLMEKVSDPDSIGGGITQPQLDSAINTRQPRIIRGATNTGAGSPNKAISANDVSAGFTPISGDILMVIFVQGNTTIHTISINSGPSRNVRLPSSVNPTPTANTVAGAAVVQSGSTALYYFNGANWMQTGSHAAATIPSIPAIPSTISLANLTNPSHTSSSTITGQRFMQAIEQVLNDTGGAGIGIDGERGRQIFAWTGGNITNISEIPDIDEGDLILNSSSGTRTILGVSAAIGTLVLVTSEISGDNAGNIRGPIGLTGAQGEPGAGCGCSSGGGGNDCTILFTGEATRPQLATGELGSFVHNGKAYRPMSGLQLGRPRYGALSCNIGDLVQFGALTPGPTSTPRQIVLANGSIRNIQSNGLYNIIGDEVMIVIGYTSFHGSAL